MLHLVDDSLESLLRAEVPLPRDVDVSFDVPDTTWGAGVTKPTVNLFLYDVRRNTQRQQSGWTVTSQDGQAVRRQPAHQVTCRYFVTVWAAAASDQHQLLGALLAALLDDGPVPSTHLVGPLADLRPAPVLAAAWPTEREPFEFWSALGGQLRAGIEVMVTLPVDRRAVVPVGPPVERVTDTVTVAGSVGEASQRVGGRSQEGSAGTLVWTPRGSTEVDPAGSFLLPARAGDDVWAESGEDAVVAEAGIVAIRGPER